MPNTNENVEMKTPSQSDINTEKIKIMFTIAFGIYFIVSYSQIPDDLVGETLSKCFLAYSIMFFVQIVNHYITLLHIERYKGVTMRKDLFDFLNPINRFPLSLIKFSNTAIFCLGIYFYTKFFPFSKGCDIYTDHYNPCTSLRIITVFTFIDIIMWIVPIIMIVALLLVGFVLQPSKTCRFCFECTTMLCVVSCMNCIKCLFCIQPKNPDPNFDPERQSLNQNQNQNQNRFQPNINGVPIIGPPLYNIDNINNDNNNTHTHAQHTENENQDDNTHRINSYMVMIRNNVSGYLPIGVTPPADGTCAICIDNDKSNEKWSKIQCGHKFHDKCIQEWFRTQQSNFHPKTCPMCRSQIDIV